MLKLKQYGIDWFILAIGILIALAYLFPFVGAAKEPVNISEIAGYGISIIFFFYGTKLSKVQFTQGVSNWKMHLLIQFTTFIFFPLVILLIKPFFVNDSLWLAVFFVAALPSTVTTSVVMVSIAKGNIPGAIFNATLSSFLGILITPLWMGIFMSVDTVSVNMSDVYMKLIFQILLPIFIGMLLHPYIGNFVKKYNSQFKILDQSIVLLIIYTSFCKSFINDSFSQFNLITFSSLLVGMLVLFLSMFYITRFLSRLLKFSYEDEITSTFCGSKKSLVHGVAISKVLFAANPISGIILLPIMLYHPLQLIFVSIYAKLKVRIFA